MYMIKPPKTFSRTSTLHNLDSHPSHFRKIRSKKCDNCYIDTPCCEADCETYQKTVEMASTLGLDSCSNCSIYKTSCNGPGQRADHDDLKERQVQVDNETISTCPF